MCGTSGTPPAKNGPPENRRVGASHRVRRGSLTCRRRSQPSRPVPGVHLLRRRGAGGRPCPPRCRSEAHILRPKPPRLYSKRRTLARRECPTATTATASGHETCLRLHGARRDAAQSTRTHPRVCPSASVYGDDVFRGLTHEDVPNARLADYCSTYVDSHFQNADGANTRISRNGSKIKRS
jgi:hypothetical protein